MSEYYPLITHKIFIQIQLELLCSEFKHAWKWMNHAWKFVIERLEILSVNKISILWENLENKKQVNQIYQLSCINLELENKRSKNLKFVIESVMHEENHAWRFVVGWIMNHETKFVIESDMGLW